MQKYNLSLLIILITLLLGVTVAEASEIQDGGTFRVAIREDPSLWPLQVEYNSIAVNQVIYSGLIRYHYENMKPVF